MGENFEKFEGSVNGTGKAFGTSSSIFTMIFGGMSVQFMGLAMKFFQTMDNIGNYQLINIPYGKMMKSVFNLLDTINQPPDFSEDIWLDNDKGKLSLEYFPNTRSKISSNFKDGFIERTAPSFIIYLVSTNSISNLLAIMAVFPISFYNSEGSDQNQPEHGGKMGPVLEGYLRPRFRYPHFSHWEFLV